MCLISHAGLHYAEHICSVILNVSAQLINKCTHWSQNTGFVCCVIDMANQGILELLFADEVEFAETVPSRPIGPAVSSSS